MKPGKIQNPATGKYVNIDGTIGKKLKAHAQMYHIFGYNHDIPNESFCIHVPEIEINTVLVGFYKEYYDLLQWFDEEKWTLKNKRLSTKVLAKLAESTSDVDTRKLIKVVKKLVIALKTFCRDFLGCDNKANIINGIVKGGDMMLSNSARK